MFGFFKKKEQAAGVAQDLEIVMTRQGFREFVVGLHSMRNKISDGDTICTMVSRSKDGKVANIILKIGRSEMNVGYRE